MAKRIVATAWLLAAILLAGLGVYSKFAQPAAGPSAEELNRAATATPHERAPLELYGTD